MIVERDKPIPLSPEGLSALQAELKDLVEVRRRVIVERVATARAEGDLRENFAYHDARRDLGMLDGRVQTIEATLRNAVVVEVQAVDGTVHHGSTVVVRDEFGESTYSLVGATEADIAKGKISIDSPLGSSLMGCRAGDEVTFETPSGDRAATVIEVR